MKDLGYWGLVCRGRGSAPDRHTLLVLPITLPVERGRAGGQPKQHPLKHGMESEAPCAGIKSALSQEEQSVVLKGTQERVKVRMALKIK